MKCNGSKTCRCKRCGLEVLARALSDGIIMRTNRSYSKDIHQESESIIEEALKGMTPIEVV